MGNLRWFQQFALHSVSLKIHLIPTHLTFSLMTKNPIDTDQYRDKLNTQHMILTFCLKSKTIPDISGLVLPICKTGSPMQF